MRKTIALALTVLVLTASALMLTSCGTPNDAQRIQGTWKLQDGTQQLVITATQIKSVGRTFDYKLGASGKITITYDSQSEDASYTLSKDGKTLTIIETIPGSTSATSTAQPTTNKLVLIRVSDSTSNEPTITAS